METQGFLLGGVENVILEQDKEGWGLKAVFAGDKNMEGYEIFGDVKAITYNEIEVRGRAPFMVQVVADI